MTLLLYRVVMLIYRLGYFLFWRSPYRSRREKLGSFLVKRTNKARRKLLARIHE